MRSELEWLGRVARPESPDITQISDGEYRVFGYVNCLHRTKTGIHSHYNYRSLYRGSSWRCFGVLLPQHPQFASQSFNRFKFAQKRTTNPRRVPDSQLAVKPRPLPCFWHGLMLVNTFSIFGGGQAGRLPGDLHMIVHFDADQ